MKVQIIGHSTYCSPDFTTDAENGSALAEFAGRACYQSWNKPNPKTATNKGYLGNIIRTGHFSVLEHGTVTFYIEGVSRSLTHELIRHRHLSFSQLSQRYVDERLADMVTPPAAEEHSGVAELIADAMVDAQARYETIVRELEEQGLSRKQAREAARAVLPNATETRIVVTGNHRAWRHFIDLRATAQADAEIRKLAVTVLRKLHELEPNIYQDYEIYQNDQGHDVAKSELSERS